MWGQGQSRTYTTFPQTNGTARHLSRGRVRLTDNYFGGATCQPVASLTHEQSKRDRGTGDEPGELRGRSPMQQFDDLMSDLAKAKNIEAAAQMDVSDRAQDHRDTKAKLDSAEQCLAAATSQVDYLRRTLHRVIEAQTHSMFDDDCDEVTHG